MGLSQRWDQQNSDDQQDRQDGSLIAKAFGTRHNKDDNALEVIMRRIGLIIAILGALGAAVWAFLLAPPGVLLKDVRAMPVPGAENNLMVTLTIENPGGPDRLLDVTSDKAKVAVLKAPDTVGLPVPSGGSPSLAMEAGHIMLMGLPDAPAEGTLVPLTLEFERAGSVATKALVQPMGMNHGMRFDVPAGEAAPEVEISVSPDGEGWKIDIATQNFTFAKDQVDQPHQPGTGHGHLYVQGIKIGRVFGDSVRIGALPPGPHTVRVTLNTNDHRAFHVDGDQVEATARIDVK